MSRENPASGEAVPGAVIVDCAPNVEKRPTAKASAAMPSRTSATTHQRREGAVDSPDTMDYFLPGASRAPVQTAFGSGTEVLLQNDVRNSPMRSSSAESTFTWAFHALTAIGVSMPS